MGDCFALFTVVSTCIMADSVMKPALAKQLNSLIHVLYLSREAVGVLGVDFVYEL